MKKIIFICLSAIIFSGCAGKYGCNDGFLSDVAKVRLRANIIEEWYINPNNPNSKMLGGSTADYGASAQKKKYNYIIKYFTHDCKEEIPKNNIYRIGSLRRGDIDYLIQISNTQRNKNISEDEILKEYKYERRYFYIKDQNGKYKIDSEIEGDYRNIAIIAIRQCFDDGYCKTYEYADGKTYYVLKKYLTPFEDDKIIAIRQCFDGGYCEIYEDYNGKIHYVIKNTQNIVK